MVLFGKNVKYSELLSTIMMYTGNECIGCIGFFATFPLIHPDQVYPNSTNIRSIGMVVKDQVIKWDHLTGYMTVMMLVDTGRRRREPANIQNI